MYDILCSIEKIGGEVLFVLFPLMLKEIHVDLKTCTKTQASHSNQN